MKSKQVILNSKEIKRILKWLKEYYGIKELKIDKGFLKNTKDKIYLISKKISELETQNIRINVIGLYFAKEEKQGYRLSIEGSQIIGPKSTKNIAELNEEQIKAWMRGEDIEYKDELESYVLIKYKKDFYGVGIYKEEKILNYVAKERRIKNI